MYLLKNHHFQFHFLFLSLQIALEVGEGRLRPALPEKSSQLEELIDLIRHSWDEDAQNRPSFATITRSLRKIREKIIESVEA